MSICDLILVMKEGDLQQMGHPQQVYDDPANLFVAKFLGTPPINTFTGTVRSGGLYLGSQRVLEVGKLPEGEVDVAIRPEGFVPEENGPLTCGLDRVEVMGRDVSALCRHDAFTGETFRIIIDADDRQKLNASQVNFRLKPNKVFLFRRDTGERIRF